VEELEFTRSMLLSFIAIIFGSGLAICLISLISNSYHKMFKDQRKTNHEAED